MDKNEKAEEALTARNDWSLLSTELNKEWEKQRREKQIINFLLAATFFLTFSALAFYIGFWVAMNKGVCP